jgi:hypothetical protein
MSARARRPTDDERTERFDPNRLARPGARIGAPPQRTDPPAAPLTPLFESLQQDATEVTPIPRAAADQVTLREMEPAPSGAAAPAVPRPPVLPAAPAERRRELQRSEPIRVISMKDQAEAQKPRRDDPRAQLQVQLRSLAEVRGRSDTPVRLGNLAPPRDPRQARARRMRDNVIWAGVAIALACVIALAIWLVARR